MNAVIYHNFDDIRLEKSPVPTIASQELLVKVHGCGLCGSDILKIVQQAPPPVIPGHELTGTIVEQRTPLMDGDSVIVVGLGSIGLLMVQAIKAFGPVTNQHIQVFGVDLLPERLQLACKLGAEAAWLAPHDEQGLRISKCIIT